MNANTKIVIMTYRCPYKKDVAKSRSKQESVS